MFFRVCLLFSLLSFVYGSKAPTDHRTKRSTEFLTFKEVREKNPDSFKISGAECTFNKDQDDCPKTYKAEGTCHLSSVSSQLFPDVNIEDSTNKFIVPAKFQVGRIEVFACDGNAKNGMVSFVANSVESVELVPQQLTLGVNTRLKLSWNTLETFNPEKLEVKLKGFTSIGSDTQIDLEVEKATDGIDYLLDFNLATLNVNNFLAKFGVDASQMISEELSFARSGMGLDTLIMQKPKVEGLYSPGGGFEIVATGTITAPQLPADANKFYLIVQDFKQGSSDSANGGYGKPIAAVFALYRKDKVTDIITSLTNINVPGLAIFRGAKDVAITVATSQLFNINSKKLRELASNYVPIEGIDMIPTGLTVMHYSRNSNSDIKDKDQKTAERILFRVEIAKESLTWTSPQRMEIEMSDMVAFVWSIRGCQDSLAISTDRKGVFVDIKYVIAENLLEVSFNLTEKVPVLSNGLVSLLNSTITLFSQKKTDNCSWKLRGKGKETMLDELVDVTISQAEHRTYVRAEAEIFDMQTLTSRLKAKPFNEEYENAFPFLQSIPFQKLGYEASFEYNRVLKFKGSALIDGTPKVEVVYYFNRGKPEMKLGFQYETEYLYKVVNTFYRDEKIKSTWIKYEHICVTVKNEESSNPMKFDRKCIDKADESLRTAGISIFAEQLIVTDCNGDEWKICNFLKTYMGDVLRMQYFGQMYPDKVHLVSYAFAHFDLSPAVEFYSEKTISRFDSTQTGDRLSFEASIDFVFAVDEFPAKIYDDGTNKIMLKFAYDPNKPSKSNGKYLFGILYARMEPVRAHFELPATKKADKIEFQSPLYIGSVAGQEVKFLGKANRQYIWYSDSSVKPKDYVPKVRFVGEKDKLKLKNLLAAFGLQDTFKFLKNSMFANQVVVAYTSLNEVWEVPDLNLKVKKGLHFYGKLTLKTKEIYDSTINHFRTDRSEQLQTVVHLNPMRFGKKVRKSKNKPSFQFINLFLTKSSEESELGPDLVYNGQIQYLQGYAETVGLEGTFRSTTLSKGEDDFQHEIRLTGNLYKEVENAEVILTTDAEDRPNDFKFKYQVDITEQGKANVNNHLRDVLSDIKKDAKKGRDTAEEIVKDVNEELDSYKAKRERYLNEMKSVQEQIHNINRDVNLAMIDISTDCIDQCKTVAMPGIEWKQDCVAESGGQQNMNCMKWNEDKERVVNVICLLKCEAKKMAAAGEAAASLREIRVLVNRYREQKVLSESIGKIIHLIEQGQTIANSAKELVDSKTDIKEEVDSLLAITGDLVTINVLKVDTDLESISPPCLDFALHFSLKTAEVTAHNGVHPICFNGEFYKNVGLRIMRIKYPAIDGMYKALEEAELRYTRIKAIKKSLERVQTDIRKESKRGNVPSPPKKDSVENMLVKIAKRRIPAFTLKGDKTMLGFHHYSPWASIKRSNPFEMLSEPLYHMKYDRSNLHGKSACHQTKEIISQYKHITDNMEHLSSNYNHGKNLFGKSKISIMKDLENSQSEIHQLMNRTRLSHAERGDMMHWYQFTKHGMNEYLQTFSNRLMMQNNQSLTYLRGELSSFYGMENFIEHLHGVGSNAISRSKINRAKRSKQINTLGDVGKALKRVLFGTVTLDHAGATIHGIKSDIENLYRTAATCI